MEAPRPAPRCPFEHPGVNWSSQALPGKWQFLMTALTTAPAEAPRPAPRCQFVLPGVNLSSQALPRKW